MNEPKSKFTAILSLMALMMAAMIGLQIYAIWGRKQPTPAPDVPPTDSAKAVPVSSQAAPRAPGTNNWVLAVVEKTNAPAPHPLAAATNVIFRRTAPDGAAVTIASAATPPPVADSVSVLAGAYNVSTASANLVGTVFLVGTPPPPAEAPMKENMCGNPEPFVIKSRQYVVGRNGGLSDVFVFIRSGTGVDRFRFDPPKDKPLLDQVLCEYQPYALGVMAGQTFTVRNSDPVMHNINSTSAKLNTGRNFAQTRKDQVNDLSFPNPELPIRFRCDVHPWMTAFVGVFSNPFFAVTDASGGFSISGVPPGIYELVAYHPKSHGANPGLVAEIEIKAGQVTAKDFKVVIQ